MEKIIATLQVVFDEIFVDAVTVTPELSARDVPEWDSLTHISLVIAVERKFLIRFRVGEVERARNVGEFAEMIHHHVTSSSRKEMD